MIGLVSTAYLAFVYSVKPDAWLAIAGLLDFQIIHLPLRGRWWWKFVHKRRCQI